MKSIFASVPYDIFIEDRESYYHTVIYLVLKLLGINVSVEIETNRGRIDCVVEKVGKAADAMSQIKEQYFLTVPFQSRQVPRKITSSRWNHLVQRSRPMAASTISDR